MNIFTFSSFSASLLCLLLANFVFYKNTKNLANRLFAVFCFLMALWGFNEGMYRSALSYEQALFWTKTNLSVWCCCATFVHFSLVFTEIALKLRKLVMSIMYAISCFGAYYEAVLAVPEKAAWGYTYAIDPNPWISNTQFAFFMSCNIIPLIVCVRYFLRADPESRKYFQIRSVLWAIAIPIVISLIELLTTFVLDKRIPEFTVVSMSWLAASIVYASWRYELFQISPEKAADQIIEMMADALVITDVFGQIVFVNSSTTKLLGYSNEDLVGVAFKSLFAKSHEEPKLFNAPEGRQVFTQNETEFRHQSGQVLMIQYALAPLVKKNELLGYILTFHDITQRKKDELEIKNLNSQLTEKNLEMEQMIYMVTHDLRSPLMNIGGITELMSMSISELEESLSEIEQEELLNSLNVLIQEEINEPLVDLSVTTNKMTELVNSLLEVAKLSNKEMSRDEIDMNLLIDNIYKSNAFRIKSLEVVAEHSDLPNCIGDRALIDQIFSNLIDNALKYTDPNRLPQIKVSAFESQDDTIYAIKDNGLGIPKDQFESIFRAFSQVDRKNEGYGIGLSTIAKFVQKQHGKIWLESELGQGTTFFVSFPKN